MKISAISDVLIVGAGPAGSACAAFCASAGLRTVLIERAVFPRDKVCGDCLNPACWPILERLGVAGRVLALPHSKLRAVEFIGLDSRSVAFPLHPSPRGEIAVKRAPFDDLLLCRAMECGAEAHEGTAVSAVERRADGFWDVRAGERTFSCRVLVAADGRNSSVAHLLGLLPRAARERIALGTHFPTPPDFDERVVLRFLPEGYCGASTVGGNEVNLCLVARASQMDALKRWANGRFRLGDDGRWRSIAPLARRAIVPAVGTRERHPLFFIGDTARVVEPFTGEGILYALASGELAARHIRERLPLSDYVRAHARLYRRRLWVNQFAKAAVLHPRVGSSLLGLFRRFPAGLRFLTGKVVGDALRSSR